LNVEIKRSVLRPFLAGVFAIAAIVIAIDLLFTYRLFSGPEENEEGARTSQGDSERRSDIAWGVGFAVVGLGLGAWAVPELIRHRSVLVADDDGIALALGRHGEPAWRAGWEDVVSVRSTVTEDDTGPVAALDIELSNASLGPNRPRGARQEGAHLLVDADDWERPVHEVAGRLQLLLERSREPGTVQTDGEME
jgi:hypothetical protein